LAGVPLSQIINPLVGADSLSPTGPVYPIGRYQVVDTLVLNGFDYQYEVTAFIRGHPNDNRALPAVDLEGPFTPSFDTRVSPHAAATSPGERAPWVAPNPYRASAPWERQPVYGDPFTRHVDFFGLPRALCRIRIYTLAGDFVTQINHDGSRGDGQASWNLISRNGQDVASGVYLFTVESAFGHTTGKFVLLR
jgi:hypothetical protein